MSNVIISRMGKDTFHEPWCPYVNRIKKENRKQISEEEAVERGYCECKFCRSVPGIVYKYRATSGSDIFYDKIDNALCVKTPVGFWKLIWWENVQTWNLFHMNHTGWKCFNPEYHAQKLMRGCFHRQRDFPPTSDVGKAIRYILAHDRNYKIAEEDIRKMPQKTPEQRRRYRQQKKRKRREEIKNVYRIFNEIERNEKK